MSYLIDQIESDQLRGVHTILSEMKRFLDEGTPIRRGALLSDDDDPVEVHVDNAIADLTVLINRIEASKYQGGV